MNSSITETSKRPPAASQRTGRQPLKVVVSNGAYRFHLAPLAAELERMGLLARLFTAGYPKGLFAKGFRAFPHAGLQRLADRREDLPDRQVRAFNSVEWLFKTGDMLFASRRPEWRQRLHSRAFRSYARQAALALDGVDCDILHYRSCFGLDSAVVAKESGRIAVCDHSIGHPYATSYMRRHAGASLPSRLEPQPLDALEQHYLEDLSLSDHVIVNSDFVKRTFLASGYPSWRVSVAYLGVDERFLSHADAAAQSSTPKKDPRHLLFCGGFGRRKGAYTLMESLDGLDGIDWTLTLSGGIEPEARGDFAAFVKRHPGRIRHRGTLSRENLARLMRDHSLFVFPTEMEGSARVVFEALASGCYVVTTPHAGSIVRDGEHGSLTQPGDVDGLRSALRTACSGDVDIEGIGASNARLVRECYRQRHYASRVVEVYGELLKRR